MPWANGGSGGVTGWPPSPCTASRWWRPISRGRMGAICVPINFRLVADEVTYIAQDSGSAALVVDAGLAPLAGEVRSRTPGIGVCLALGDDAEVAGPGA